MKQFFYHALLYLLAIAPLLAQERPSADAKIYPSGPWCQKDAPVFQADLFDLGPAKICALSDDLGKLGVSFLNGTKETQDYCFVPLYKNHCLDTLQLNGKVQCLSPLDARKNWKIDLENSENQQPLKSNYFALVPKKSFQRRCMDGEGKIKTKTCLNYLETHSLGVAPLFNITPEVIHHLLLWDGQGNPRTSSEYFFSEYQKLSRDFNIEDNLYRQNCLSLIIGHPRGLKQPLGPIPFYQISTTEIDLNKFVLPPGPYITSHLRTLFMTLEKIEDLFESHRGSVVRGEYKYKQSLSFFLESLPEKPGKLYEFIQVENKLQDLLKKPEFSFLVLTKPDVLDNSKKIVEPKVIKTGLFSFVEDDEKTPPIEIDGPFYSYKEWLKSIVSYDPLRTNKAIGGEQGPYAILNERLLNTWPLTPIPPTPMLKENLAEAEKEMGFYPLRSLAVESIEKQNP